MNKCSGCGLNFSSVGMFDKHRVTDKKTNQRRCLTQKELTKMGMVEKDGTWTIPMTPEQLAKMKLAWGKT